jgi:hypothetical protein
MVLLLAVFAPNVSTRVYCCCFSTPNSHKQTSCPRTWSVAAAGCIALPTRSILQGQQGRGGPQQLRGRCTKAEGKAEGKHKRDTETGAAAAAVQQREG